MKRIICALLIGVLFISFSACKDSNDNNMMVESNENSKIKLTKDNIGRYLHFEGEFVENEWLSYIPGYGGAISTFKFHTYPISSGNFNHVKLVLKVVDMVKGRKRLENTWHLLSSEQNYKDQDYIEINFYLPADGGFAEEYRVACRDEYIPDFPDECKFEVMSVSGTFIPNK